MAIKYISNGTTFNSAQVDNVYNKIPVGQYYVRIDREGRLYLEKTEWKEETVIYGDEVGTRVHRCINAFINNPDRNVGFAFMGDSGSGKSLTMRKLALTAMKQFEMPIFIIDQAISGQMLTNQLRKFAKEAVIIFDEFEKTYSDKDSLGSLLPFFDGVNTETRFMIIVTGNDNIGSQYFYNRPGRIYYLYQYGKLPENEVRLFLEKQLDDKSKIEEILLIREISNLFSYDILRSIVNECNLYPEMPLKEAIGPLPLNIDLFDRINFNVSLIIDGKAVSHNVLSIDISQVINFRKYNTYASKSMHMFLRPKHLLELILRHKNNESVSPIIEIDHSAYIFSDKSYEKICEEKGDNAPDGQILDIDEAYELASKPYAVVGNTQDNVEENSTILIRGDQLLEKFNPEGFFLPIDENTRFEFIPSKSRFSLSNLL